MSNLVSACSFISMGILISNPLVFAGNKYYFNKKTLQCENSKGKVGYNSKGWSSCSDLRLRSLDKLKGRVNLTASTFEGRTLKHQTFNDVTFDHANLQLTNLDNITFKNSSLKGCDLRKAKLRHLFLDESSLAGSFIDSTTQLKGIRSIRNGIFFSYKDVTLSKNPKNLENLKEFAFLNNMIYLSYIKNGGGLLQIEGGAFRKIKWDDGRQSGFAFLDLYSKKILLFIDEEDVAVDAEQFKKGEKVIVQIQSRNGKKYLVHSEKLE